VGSSPIPPTTMTTKRKIHIHLADGTSYVHEYEPREYTEEELDTIFPRAKAMRARIDKYLKESDELRARYYAIQDQIKAREKAELERRRARLLLPFKILFWPITWPFKQLNNWYNSI
jgi:type II secretory pathway component PulM